MDAEEITRRREALGLSRAAMAREIGVNTATLWRWESGRFNPTPLIAKRLDQVMARLERRRTSQGGQSQEGAG